MLEKIFEGVEFGDPWRFNAKSLCAVVPVLRHSAIPRSYVLLEEVKDKVEINDTGSIGAATIRNHSDSDVFVRKGTLFKGSSQERVVVMGLVVPPQTEKTIEIQCVHASKGIRMGAAFRPAGVAPRIVMQSCMARRGQAETWSAVSRASGFLMAASAPHVGQESNPMRLRSDFARTMQDQAVDDLVGTLEATQKFREDIEDILRRVPGEMVDQVGIVVVGMKGVVGLEVFDHPDSWRGFSKSVVRSYADVLSEESTGLFEIKLDAVLNAVREFVKKIQEAEPKSLGDVRDGTKPIHTATYVLEGKDVVGEFTELKSETIHVIASRKEPEETADRAVRLHASQWPPRTDRRSEPVTTTPQRRSYQYTQYRTTSGPLDPMSEVFTGKATCSLMMALNQNPKTFNELHKELPVSTRTLAARLHGGQDKGLIGTDVRIENGRKTWTLTPDGKQALEWARRKTHK
jgi:DNA-binding HxlR family transcriptional regulator